MGENQLPGQSSHPESPRRRIGRYELEGELGRGGMGVVYRGRSPDGTKVAIKVLHTALPGGQTLRRFQREARLQIDHPNITRVLDADAEGATPFIVFELLDGETLSERLQRGTITPEEAVSIGVQACSGLAAAHSRGIIHRDLKPGNLFLCTDETLKLLDFGIALWTEEQTRLTAGEWKVLGTPSYLSPEQARGESVDQRSDVWSLGVVLYHALSGRRPFTRDSAMATMLAVVLETAPPLSRIQPAVPSALGTVIDRCLAKAKESRYPSMIEFGEALRAVDLRGERPTRVSTEAVPVAEPTLTMQVSSPTISDAAEMSVTITAGERRVVTILLAHGVIESSSLERAIVERGGGYVPLLGQRALGLFGGERWEGDEAIRAVSAALQARQCALRVSVASGRASGSGATIYGAAIRAAQDGCDILAEGVVVSKETAAALEHRFEVRELENGYVEALRMADADAPQLLTQMGHALSPLLGRDVEVAQLRRALRAVEEESEAKVALVIGPPGIGKSRLRYELERIILSDSQSVTVVGCRAEPTHRNTSLATIAGLIRNHARAALGGDLLHFHTQNPENDKQQFVLRLLKHIFDDAKTSEVAAFIGELLGVSMPSTVAFEAAQRDPGLMADRIRMAVFDYFEALASNGMLALWIEDIQWVDAGSMGLLRELMERLAENPFFVLLTGRPELRDVHSGIQEYTGLVQIDLTGLGAREVSDLVTHIAERSVKKELVDAIFERTGGNPMFIEQIVTALKESNAFDSATRDLPLPLTIEAAVQSRLDHLPVAAKDACKRASVLSRPFTSDELTALGAIHADETLALLVRRDLVSVRRHGRETTSKEYRFRSTLVADVAYRMITDDLRAELHRKAALHLERTDGVEPEEIARHYELGGETAKAAGAYALAALHAARRGDTNAVLRCSELSLSLGVGEQRRFQLHMVRADALRFLGRREEQAGELKKALSLASTDSEQARVLTEQAVWLARTGDTTQALSVSEAAVEAAQRAGEDDALALAYGWEAMALMYSGRLDEARETLARATNHTSQAGPQMRALTVEWRAQLTALMGDLVERRNAFAEAVQLYKEAGDVRRAAGAESNLADAYNRFGAYTEAEHALREAVSGCRLVNNRLMEGYALANLGYSLAMLKRTDEALEALEQARSLAENAREARLSVVTDVYEARARLDGPTASPSAIATSAEKAAETAMTIGLPSVAALALCVAARAHLMTGATDKAVENSCRAVAIRDQLGSVEEDEIELFLVQARAFRAKGQTSEAKNALERGKNRLKELTEKISDLEWRKRFLSAVSAHHELIEELRIEGMSFEL